MNKSLKRIVHCIVVRIDSPTDVADVIVVEGVTDVDADAEFDVEDEVDVSSAVVVIVTVLEVSVQTKLIDEINDYRYGLPPRSWKVSG